MTYQFAYSPDGPRPARVIRFVPRGMLPDNYLSVYDYDQNLVLIDEYHYGQLTPHEQEQLMRTHEPVTEVYQDWPSHDVPYQEAAE